MAAYLCHYAKKITGAERIARRNTRDKVYVITYVLEQAQQLAAHLYYPGCLALDHKKANATAIQTWKRPAGMRKAPPRIAWTAEKDRILLAAPTLADAAATLQLSQSACQVRRWKLTHGLVALPD
ncbi:hypothetical protein ACIGO8_32005 [Streptomyces sp. NPDC053493]|uniref:hypothetical protein n=1 Tax=Streptomyces sp. NPDC053493 TaxID=3365705 RepID=UPI0037D89CE8